MHTRTVLEDKHRQKHLQSRHANIVVVAIPQTMPSIWKTCTECSKIGHFRVMCRSRKTRAMKEVQQEAVQDSAGENCIDLVSIKSIQFNKNCSVLTTNLKMSAGQNSIMVPYEVDTDTSGNTMPLHVYKNKFQKISIISGVHQSSPLGRSYQETVYNQTHRKSRPWWTCHPPTIKKNSRLSCVLLIT